MSNAIVQVGPIEKLPNGKALVRGTLGGTFNKEDTPLIKSWVEGMGNEIKKSADSAKPVYVMVDISKFEKYTVTDGITLITDFLNNNHQLIAKIATVGGTMPLEIAEFSISSISHINIKNYKNGSEAVKWLLE